MSLARRSIPHLRKPSPTRINLGHRFAGQLKHAWLLQDLRAAVGGLPLANAGVSPTIIASDVGRVSRFSGAAGDAYDVASYATLGWSVNTEPATFIVWFRLDGTPSDTTHMTIVGGDNGSVGQGFGIWYRVGDSNNLAGYAGPWNTNTTPKDGSVIEDGRWHLIVFTLEGESAPMVLYLDGEVFSTGTAGGTINNIQGFVIGQGFNTREFGPGEIGEVYLFQRVIGAAEARWHYENRFGLLQPRRIMVPVAAAGVTAAVTGTATSTIIESDIVTGGKTIIITLTGDTWKAAGTGPIGSTADTQAIIDGLDSAQVEGTGWNAEVRDKEVTTAVVRTSSTVATITLTAAAAYDITAQETITVTVPTAALVTGAAAITATPTFTVDLVSVGVIINQMQFGNLGADLYNGTFQ